MPGPSIMMAFAPSSAASFWTARYIAFSAAIGAPKELTGPTTVNGRVGSLKSISTSDDWVGWYKRLLVRVPEPVVHADRMTDVIANMTTSSHLSDASPKNLSHLRCRRGETKRMHWLRAAQKPRFHSTKPALMLSRVSLRSACSSSMTLSAS